MRKINPQPLNNNKWTRWCRDCEKEKRKSIEAVNRGKNPVFTNLYKRKSIKDEYFFNKRSFFFGKCAYCESYIPDFQHGDVEHFRPKGGITDEYDNPIYLKDNEGNEVKDNDGNPIPHPGYYWLAYDWTNLLPSCKVCNEPKTIGNKKIGKHNRFPVKGIHAQKEDELQAEQPLLINPLSTHKDDDPEKHLKINTNNGVLEPLTERGLMCIDILGLNLRDQLVADRLRACREIRNLILQMITNPERGNTIKSEIIEIKEGKRSYTFAALAALKEIQELLFGL